MSIVATPVEAWGKTVHTESVDKSVKLTDAPDITWQRKAKYGPGRGRPYSIRFEFRRHNGGPWRSEITIYAKRPAAICGERLFPGSEPSSS